MALFSSRLFQQQVAKAKQLGQPVPGVTPEQELGGQHQSQGFGVAEQRRPDHIGDHN